MQEKYFLHRHSYKTWKSFTKATQVLRVLSKGKKKYLEKALQKLQMDHKNPRQTSRVHDKSGKTGAVISS